MASVARRADLLEFSLDDPGRRGNDGHYEVLSRLPAAAEYL